MKVLALVLCLAAAATARMAYRFSDGYLDILGAEPVQNFDCTARSYGYYADVGTDCQVFHVCLPITDDAGELAETAHFSFFCGNGTRFDQESLTCNHEDSAFPCEEAETLYELSNADFGRIPEGGFDVVLEGSSNVEASARAPAPAPVRARARSEAIPSAPTAELASEAEADAETDAEAEVEEESDAPAAPAEPAAPLAIPSSVPVQPSTADADADADADAEAEANTEAADVTEDQP